MRILLTRPAAEAPRSAEQLAANGHQIVLSPVIEMCASGAAWPSGVIEGMIATSAAAFELAQFSPEWPSPEARRLFRIFVVGNKTAEAARRCGFAGGIVMAPDAKNLTEAILGAVHAPARLVYLAGHDRKPDLETLCRNAGIDLSVVEIYEARAARAFSDEALAAFARGEIDAVLHYSRRSAEIFLDLAGTHRIDPKRLRHAAISSSAAAPLQSKACGSVAVAAEPNEKALLALLSNIPRNGGRPK
jgi:uroporphyrinogen-III synthase